MKQKYNQRMVNSYSKLCIITCDESNESNRKGAAADLIFQSLAGTEAGNDSFGISLSMLDEATALIHEKGQQKVRTAGILKQDKVLNCQQKPTIILIK